MDREVVLEITTESNGVEWRGETHGFDAAYVVDLGILVDCFGGDLVVFGRHVHEHWLSVVDKDKSAVSGAVDAFTAESTDDGTLPCVAGREENIAGLPL